MLSEAWFDQIYRGRNLTEPRPPNSAHDLEGVLRSGSDERPLSVALQLERTLQTNANKEKWLLLVAIWAQYCWARVTSNKGFGSQQPCWLTTSELLYMFLSKYMANLSSGLCHVKLNE